VAASYGRTALLGPDSMPVVPLDPLGPESTGTVYTPTTSAIVFAFEEVGALRRCLPSLLASSVGEIYVMYGGTDGSREYVDSIADPRLHGVYETIRAGKWRAFNRAIELVRGEVVLLVSGDTTFDPTVIDRLVAQCTPDVGVVFPRVVPTNISGGVTSLGATLWELHDAQIIEFERKGLPVHGGELQAVRRTLLEPINGVVNEDAYLCLRAVEQGYRVLYDRSTVIGNTVPEVMDEFLAQRTRVNYGHRQLAAVGRAPSTLDRLIWKRPEICVRVLARLVVDDPMNAFRLAMLAAVELVALTKGNRDFARRIDYSRWTLIRSGKGAPGAPDE
jgi:cellulose synthase/poly-beta-1,6-N-acetylglucosamine synthase-like glycosyltransferase